MYFFRHTSQHHPHSLRHWQSGLRCSALALLLSGCASYPSSVAVPDPDMLPSLQQIQANPEQYQHQTVVLGGQIISVINGDQHTTLEILQRPLWDSGQPRSDSDRSDGRFRAEFDYFIDPETYQSGRLVTVRGQLTGMDEGHIGEHPYRFAHIQADGIELWRKTSAPEVRYHFVWGVGPYYGYPYPYRSAVITGAKPLKHPVPKHPAHPKASTP